MAAAHAGAEADDAVQVARHRLKVARLQIPHPGCAILAASNCKSTGQSWVSVHLTGLAELWESS